MHHLLFGIDFQIHSVSLTILVSIHLIIHFSTHLCHPSLFHSFTPGSKPTFSTNPSHSRFLLPTGLPHDNGTGPLSCSSFYFQFHILIFCLFRVVDQAGYLSAFYCTLNTHYSIASNGVNKFCKKSSVYSLYKHITDRRKCYLNSRASST